MIEVIKYIPPPEPGFANIINFFLPTIRSATAWPSVDNIVYPFKITPDMIKKSFCLPDWHVKCKSAEKKNQ